MKTISNKVLWTAGILLFCSASGAMATPGNNFTLTGVNGNYLGGVFTSPYYATITDSGGALIGVGIPVICDDFATESYVGQSFSATATSVASLNGGSEVKWDKGAVAKQQKDYATAAFLVGEILDQEQITDNGKHKAEILSFALWALFDPDALGHIGSSDADAATKALGDAGRDAKAYTEYSDFEIWTPSPDQNVSQEFVTRGIHPPGVAEPSSVAILCLDLLGVAGLLLVVRRRVARGVKQ